MRTPSSKRRLIHVAHLFLVNNLPLPNAILRLLFNALNALPAFTREGEAIAFVDPLKICEEEGLLRLKTWIEATLARPSVKSIELPEEEMIQSATKMLKRFAAM